MILTKKISNLNELLVLIEVLRILRNEDNRKARRVVYHTFLEYKISKNSKIFQKPKIKNLIDLVKGDFDEIGFWMSIGLLKKEPFFALYSDTIRRCWISLKNNIIIERKLRNKKNSKKTSEVFMNYFEYLANQAKKYRDSKNLKEPKIIKL